MPTTLVLVDQASGYPVLCPLVNDTSLIRPKLGGPVLGGSRFLTWSNNSLIQLDTGARTVQMYDIAMDEVLPPVSHTSVGY